MTTSARRALLAALATAAALSASATAFALSKDPIDPEKAAAARNAPAPRLLPPPPAQPAGSVPKQPMADTSALLPSGNYVMAITLRNETHEDDAKVTRNGAAITVALSGGAVMQGTVAPDGRMELTGAGNNNALKLTGTVAQLRGSGQAQLARGTQAMAGSFFLSPATGARKLKDFDAPKKGGPECGFFCKLGKAWDCLSNWTKC